jgi:hypothetical protein
VTATDTELAPSELPQVPDDKPEDPIAPTTGRSWADAVPILLLVAFPAVVFGAAYFIFGHLLLVGDNAIQNYPLRVLVGRDISHGVFPSWNPWIFGGTPLLAGLNAGALYPLTWLFAILSSGSAWVLNEIFVFASVAVGTYVFLRVSGTSKLAGGLAAFSFAFAGAVAGQGAVHIDMSEGFASLPWLLLAVRQIIADGRWRWCWLLAVASCLVILSGSPESILYLGCLTVTYGIVRLTVTAGHRLTSVVKAGLGALAGLGASAMLWLPALGFINTSQRASETSAFVSSFSYPPKELLLGVVPFLLGGSKLFSQPIYFGQSNLPEVTMYVGILPLIALGALASRRWRERLPVGERRTWLTIAIVGAVLAIGAGTPLGHVIGLIPLYGKQRDQGRNIVDVDFAACCAFAWWIDGSRAVDRLRKRTEVWTALGLIAVVVAIGTAFTFFRGSFWSWMRASPQASSTVGSLYLAIAVAAVLVIGGAGIVWLSTRLDRSRWRKLVTGFVAVDMALFLGGSFLWSSQPVPTASRPGPVWKIVSRNLPPGGRYALYNPDLFFASTLLQSPEPDVGIHVKDSSPEGYTAVQNAGYITDTSTHLRNSLKAADVRTGVFNQLDLDVIVAPAEYFLMPVSAAPASSQSISFISQGPDVDPLLPGGNTPLPQDELPPIKVGGDNTRLGAGSIDGWFFGTALAPTSVNVALLHPASNQVVKIGTLATDGKVTWGAPQHLTGTNTAFKLSGADAIGIELRLVHGKALRHYQMSVGEGGHEFLVDGPLARAVGPLDFSQVGFANDLAVFRTRRTLPVAWAQALGTQDTLAGASHLAARVRVVSQTSTSETIAIQSPKPALLVRSVAFDGGWYASIVSGSAGVVASASARSRAGDGLGGGKTLGVVRAGAVQGVPVPSGWSVVEFSYRPKGLGKGEVVAAATGIALVLAYGGWLAARTRHRRHSRPGAGAPAAETVSGAA